MQELAAYLTCYFLLNAFYRSVLVDMANPHYRQLFESLRAYCYIQVCTRCHTYHSSLQLPFNFLLSPLQMSSIPMTFGLGFYVSLIVKRWWDQYQLLPWPDSLAIFIVGMLVVL